MPSSKSTKHKPKISSAAVLTRPGSKLAKVLALMQRQQGATVAELVKATGWQKHTVRGAISGAVKKKLHQRVKVIDDGDRRAYAIVKLSGGKGSRVDPAAKALPATHIEPAAS